MVQPILESALITLCTLFSLPGTGVAEIITVSLDVTVSDLWSPLTMRERALIGSP